MRAAICALLVVSAGCAKPEFVPVQGRVTLEGQAVKSVAVNFTPLGETKGTGALAVTDDDGRYTLMDSRGAAGARVGEYKVSFYPVSTSKPGDAADAGGARRPSLPAIYLDPHQTPLRATVPEGGGTIDILLTKSGEGASTKTVAGKAGE